MAKRILVFVVISIILIIVAVKLSEKSPEQSRDFEKDYQEGIKLISGRRYGDAAIRLVYAFAADYKYSRVLYYYAAAAKEEVGSHWYEHYRAKLPFDYNGPLADRVLGLKRGDPAALKSREEYKKETSKTMPMAPVPAAPTAPPPKMANKEREQSDKKGESLWESKNPTYKAVELVKNHPTLPTPDTGKMRSVEKRMIDARESFFPNMTWRYEVIVIEKDKYRVTQYVDNGRGESFIRTWTVNISDNEVEPENLAAKKLYY